MEQHGVFHSGSVYNQHAIARILGVADNTGPCSTFVLERIIKAGVPFVKLGHHYLVSGDQLNIWVRENAKPWGGCE